MAKRKRAAKTPAKRRFNPVVEHAKVTPPYNGAVFYQRGGYFNADGDLLWEDDDAPKSVKLTRKNS